MFANALHVLLVYCVSRAVISAPMAQTVCSACMRSSREEEREEGVCEEPSPGRACLMLEEWVMLPEGHCSCSNSN